MSTKKAEQLYGDKPTFTYKPKGGGDPIVFPAHSTIRGRVNGETYLQFLRKMDKQKLSNADQMFAYLDRSDATEEMEDRLLGLDDEAEVMDFFRAWVNHDDQPQQELPPES